MAIGFALGRDTPDQSRDQCYLAVDQLHRDFVREFGTRICRELTGVDLKTPEGIEAHRSRIHEERCKPIVAWTARRVDELIQENIEGAGKGRWATD